MGTSDDWQKQATRLRELTREGATRSFALGWFIAHATPAELEDLVEGCLVYRERFGASGNDRRKASAQVVSDLEDSAARYAYKQAADEARRLGLPDL